MKITEKGPQASLKKIFEEYDKDLLNDDDNMYKLKEIIGSLPDLDRTLLILYADTGSMRKTSQLLHVSDYTIWINVDRIRKYIKNELQK